MGKKSRHLHMCTYKLRMLVYMITQISEYFSVTSIAAIVIVQR